MKITKKDINLYPLFKYEYNSETTGYLYYLEENTMTYFQIEGDIQNERIYTFFYNGKGNRQLFKFLGMDYDDIENLYLNILGIPIKRGDWPYTNSIENTKRVLEYLYQNQVEISKSKDIHSKYLSQFI